MGSSISVALRNPKLRDQMAGFLQRCFKLWSEVVGDDDGELEMFFEGPLVDDLEGVEPGRCIIGFNFLPSPQPEREYHYALMRWIALQAGKRRNRFRAEGLVLDQAVPYLLFDGYETLPILLDTEWTETPSELTQYVCNRFGMPKSIEVARELAWFCLPEEIFDRLSVTHRDKSAEEVSEALIDSGLPTAWEVLGYIQAQIERLDVLWRDANRPPAPRSPGSPGT